MDSLLTFVKNELICPICLDHFSEAKFLPVCGHSLCHSCIVSLLKNYRTLECPICRQTSIIPQGNPRNLPNNFIAQSLIQYLKVIGELPQENIAKSLNKDIDEIMIDNFVPNFYPIFQQKNEDRERRKCCVLPRLEHQNPKFQQKERINSSNQTNSFNRHQFCELNLEKPINDSFSLSFTNSHFKMTINSNFR